jgi:hypothetical protein
VGPLDVDLKPRNSTWLQKADLIFVVSQSSESDSSAPQLPVFFHTTRHTTAFLSVMHSYILYIPLRGP